MSTTLTIKPAGGGDYPDVATWEADLGSGDQIGECYAGDICSGFVNIDDATPDSIVLVAAAAAMHQGAFLGSLASVAHATGGIYAGRGNVTIRGLASTGGFFTAFGVPTGNNIIFDKLLLQGAANAAMDPLLGETMTGCAIRNCVAYYAGGFASAITATCFANTETTALTIAIENNSIYCSDTSPYGISWDLATFFAGGSVTLNLTLRNNVVIGAATADFAQDVLLGGGGPGTETLNLTSATNVSSDSTADNFGGSGHLVGQTAGGCFTSTTNLAPKAGSPLLDVGTTIGAVATDILGVARPQGDAYDIGAFEVVPSGESSLGGARARRLRRWRRG